MTSSGEYASLLIRKIYEYIPLLFKEIIEIKVQIISDKQEIITDQEKGMYSKNFVR